MKRGYIKPLTSIEVYYDEDGTRYLKVPDDISLLAFLRPFIADADGSVAQETENDITRKTYE